MTEYTEEFYRLNIRAGQRERDEKKNSRYINGLRYEIQDEIRKMTVRKMEDAYHIVMKEEENLARNQSQQRRGRSLNRGKGISHDKAHKPKGEAKKPHSHSKRGGSS
jgi:hypothetical protein